MKQRVMVFQGRKVKRGRDGRGAPGVLLDEVNDGDGLVDEVGGAQGHHDETDSARRIWGHTRKWGRRCDAGEAEGESILGLRV